MNSSRFLYGGLNLGEADIMGKRGLNGASVLLSAVRQFNVANSVHAQSAATKAQQIIGNFQGLSGHIAEALSLAQNESGAGYHAVSCGWWLGQGYGCCKYGVQDIQSSELMRFILSASDHAMALLQAGNTNWNNSKIDHQFGVIAEGVYGLVGVNALKAYAPKVNTVASQFATSLR